MAAKAAPRMHHLYYIQGAGDRNGQQQVRGSHASPKSIISCCHLCIQATGLELSLVWPRRIYIVNEILKTLHTINEGSVIPPNHCSHLPLSPSSLWCAMPHVTAWPHLDTNPAGTSLCHTELLAQPDAAGRGSCTCGPSTGAEALHYL